MSTSRYAKNEQTLDIPEDVMPFGLTTSVMDSSRAKTNVKYSDFIKDGGVVDTKAIKKFKNAKLYFILDKKKLTSISIQSSKSLDNSDIVYGKIVEEEIDGKKQMMLKRWAINSLVTNIDLTTDDGFSLFCACLVNPSVKDSLNQNIDYLRFKLVLPEQEADSDVKGMDQLYDALALIKKMPEADMDNIALMLTLPTFKQLGEKEKRAALMKIAQEQPTTILSLADVDNNKYNVLFLKAREAKVIKEVRGIFTYGEYKMGVTPTDAISWLQQNDELAQLMEDSLNRKK